MRLRWPVALQNCAVAVAKDAPERICNGGVRTYMQRTHGLPDDTGLACRSLCCSRDIPTHKSRRRWMRRRAHICMYRGGVYVMRIWLRLGT